LEVAVLAAHPEIPEHTQNLGDTLSPSHLRLSALGLRVKACVVTVEDICDPDPIAQRLRELGFVEGEPLHITTRGPFGGAPLLVQIGFTRFALRRSEAFRVKVGLV
jgi:ferrous iron transport protein A